VSPHPEISLFFFINPLKHGTGAKTDMQTNGKEDSEINPHSPLILDKGVPDICWRKDSLFNK
jgi:hypothetical protein